MRPAPHRTISGRRHPSNSSTSDAATGITSGTPAAHGFHLPPIQHVRHQLHQFVIGQVMAIKHDDRLLDAPTRPTGHALMRLPPDDPLLGDHDSGHFHAASVPHTVAEGA